MRYLALVALLMTGCSASMVQTRTGGPHAPVNERTGGIIKYLYMGSKTVIEKRRQDAYRQMHEHCRGAYRITVEGEKAGTTVNLDPILGQMSQDNYWVIDFECEAKQ